MKMRGTQRRGAALIIAIWVIAVLSIMVLSFATEAKLQSGINIYLRERNRVNRLVEAGQVLAEVIISRFNEEAKEWSPDENHQELIEENRWYREMRALKYDSRCTVGPIIVDDERPEDGTVTVDIELVNAGEKNAINVNELYETSDKNYRVRWEMIFQSHGIPEELSTENDGVINLWNLLIASWNDWRDEDDTSTSIDGEDCGAESSWYEEEYEDKRIDDEDKRFPRNGSIPDIQELASIRGFRDYPAVLTGGVINPWEREEDQITVTGLVDLLGTTGSSRVNVNNCTVEQLMTIPGIFNEEDESDMGESRMLAQAILDGLKELPDYEVDETLEKWPYKDWNDLTARLQDIEIGNEANEYLIYTPDDNSIFKVKIKGESMGISHTVLAECYYSKDKKTVRYIKWRED